MSLMDRRVVWILVGVGMALGGLLPDVWGGSALGVASLALASLGGLAGLWLALKLIG
jgi:hypothetical protein